MVNYTLSSNLNSAFVRVLVSFCSGRYCTLHSNQTHSVRYVYGFFCLFLTLYLFKIRIERLLLHLLPRSLFTSFIWRFPCGAQHSCQLTHHFHLLPDLASISGKVPSLCTHNYTTNILAYATHDIHHNLSTLY